MPFVIKITKCKNKLNDYFMFRYIGNKAAIPVKPKLMSEAIQSKSIIAKAAISNATTTTTTATTLTTSTTAETITMNTHPNNVDGQICLWISC